MTLRDVIEAAAAGLPGTSRAERDHGVEWSAAGRVFAVVHEAGAEFDLDPVIARAALGTPDTTTSTRRPGWVSFRPAELDRMAVDRADAWFRSAARRAGVSGD